MNIDEEEGMSNEEQLRHLLLLFIVLFQAKHLSVKAGEDLLAFLSFFVRSLGHGMEIPTKISTARTMVNYSTASNGLSRFLVCSACRSVYTSGSLHSRSCGYVRFPHNPYRQAQPCGNALFAGSSLKPVLEYPYNSITETLKKFFMRPSFEQQIEQWRRRSVDEDVMFDIYDGRVWNQLVDSNGQIFTSQPRSLMVSLNVDWFQPSDNMKHSSGAIYLAINNLPRNTRMKFSNIVLAGVIPGPHEPNDDQIQNFLKPLVDELLVLYNGVIMPTYENPNGELVRVALMSINCDMPAARKVAGYMGAMATKACNKCSTAFGRLSTGTRSSKPNFSDFNDENWVQRTWEQQRFDAYDWLTATHKAQQEEKQASSGTKWSEVHRLPYFDVVRYVTVDPMHNLFLGTPKKMIEVWQDFGLLVSTDFPAMATESTTISIPQQYAKLSEGM